MVFKRFLLLFCVVLVFVKPACLAVVQQVKYFEVFQDRINIGDIDYNQCDILLKKNIILIGPWLFCVKKKCELIHTFFGDVRDLSSFKKVEISPDGKYVGFLCDGSKPVLHVWKTDNLAKFTRFTKVNINFDFLGNKTIASFCFSDDDKLILMTLPENLIMSVDNFVTSFDDLFKLSDDNKDFLYYLNLKNDDWDEALIDTYSDFVDIDFLKRDGAFLYLVGKRVNGDVFLLGSDGNNLYKRMSCTRDLATKIIKCSSDNKFIFLYDNCRFDMWDVWRKPLILDVLLDNQKNKSVLDAVVPNGRQLKCAMYETDIGADYVGKFALIYSQKSNIFYSEWLI